MKEIKMKNSCSLCGAQAPRPRRRIFALIVLILLAALGYSVFEGGFGAPTETYVWLLSIPTIILCFRDALRKDDPPLCKKCQASTHENPQ